jgi:hypothetical protein
MVLALADATNAMPNDDNRVKHSSRPAKGRLAGSGRVVANPSSEQWVRGPLLFSQVLLVNVPS